MSYPSGVNVYSPKIRESAVARKFVSQYGMGYLALGVYNYNTQQPVDPLADTISLKIWFNDVTEEFPSDDPRGELIKSVDDHSGSDTILKDDIGKFYYNLGPEITAKRGVLTAEWKYEFDNRDWTFQDFLQITDQMPSYDRLTPESKALVESCSYFFADLFDSTEGGPFAAENFQSHFNYERLSQLLVHAVAKLNVTGYPITHYGIGLGESVVPKNMTGILQWALKLEVIRHLMRSYTEIPVFQQPNVTFADRTAYLQRWREVLEEEKPDFERAVKMVKREQLNLGRGALLVAGGIFGGGARGIFQNGMGFQAAATRGMRFYPASFAIMGTGNNMSR